MSTWLIDGKSVWSSPLIIGHPITIIRSILIFLAALAASDARAQTASSLTAHHTQAKLVLSAVSAKPGDTIWAGVDMKMDAGWHTYWKNPGEAGMATSIKWQLPSGISAGEILWPVPEKIPPAEVTTYGYTNEVMLLVPLTLPTNLPNGPVDLKASVSWLECKDVCLPASAMVDAMLNVGSETRTSADAELIKSWIFKTPHTDNLLTINAWWEKPADGDTRSLIISGDQVVDYYLGDVDFFPDASDQFEVEGATERIPGGNVRLRKIVKKFSGYWPREISGLIVVEGGKQRDGFNLKVPIGDKAPN